MPSNEQKLLDEMESAGWCQSTVAASLLGTSMTASITDTLTEMGIQSITVGYGARALVLWRKEEILRAVQKRKEKKSLLPKIEHTVGGLIQYLEIVELRLLELESFKREFK